MRSDYRQKPWPSSRTLTSGPAHSGNSSNSGNSYGSDESVPSEVHQEDVADQMTQKIPLIKEMGTFLDASPAANGMFISIDQFATGPFINFDQLETAMLPTIISHPPSTNLPASSAATTLVFPPTLNLPARTPANRTAESARRSNNSAQSQTGIQPHEDDIAAFATVKVPTLRDLTTEDRQPSTWELTTLQLHAIAPRLDNYRAVATKLLKSSGLYAIAALGGPAISLALAPFLAHNLTPESYGELAILNTIISLAAGVTQLGLGPAFFRAYNYDFTSDEDRRSVIASVSLLLGVITLPISLLAIIYASTLSELLFHQPNLSQLVTLAAIAVLVQNLTVPGFAWLRAENRALLFSLVSLVNILLSFGANIVLVGVMHMGVTGALWAVVIGYGAVVLLVTPPLIVVSRLRMRPQIIRSVLSFGVPQVLSVISVWVLQLSDRYLLEIFGTLAQTASYSIAYSLGSTLSTLILAPFSLAWPTAMYAIARRQDAPQTFQKVFRWFSATLLFAAFSLSLASSVIFNTLFPPSYHSAAPVIPIVAESIAFYGIYTIVMIGANVRRKTWMVSVFTTIAAVLNFGLNLVLIPRYGAMGAAFSTLIAYAVLALIAYIANQRIYHIPFEVGRFLLATIAGMAIYYEIFGLPQYWGVSWTWPLAVSGIVLYGGLLVLIAISASPIRGRIQPAPADAM